MGFFKVSKPARVIELEDAINDMVRSHTREIEDMKLNYERTIDRLQHEHHLEKERVALEHKFSQKEEVRILDGELKQSEKEKAVLTEKVAMLEKMVDLNGDIVDVKEMVAGIIKKLPEVNISGLTVQAPSSK